MEVKMKILNVISIEQGCHTMYIFKLSTEELLSNYSISSYNSAEETGYQRPPVEAHYKKIARYLADVDSEQILPMSIIAAAAKNDITYQGNVLTIDGKMRIVDGQHRIKAIEYLRDEKSSKYRSKYEELVRHYEFPVILLITNEFDSVLEMDTFININSKGKRVSTNLAKELREKKMQVDLEKHEIPLTKESYENLATQVVKLLAHDTDSIWYGRIQMGDEAGMQKPVSIGTFARSLKKITMRVTDMVVRGAKVISEENAREAAERTKVTVEQLWKAVQERWPECFDEPKQYNLLRGLGVSVVHRLFESCIKAKDFPDPAMMLEDAQETFVQYLNKTEIGAEEWMVGSTFTGFSSEQGYGIIVNILQGEKALNELDD
ncbi:MAG: DGQHR domain-containing protein [Lachnospiraceae bacterium]|nr:DGQHR domain-containing protein [Lachnospiraceae bacterium]